MLNLVGLESLGGTWSVHDASIVQFHSMQQSTLRYVLLVSYAQVKLLKQLKESTTLEVFDSIYRKIMNYQ